MEEGAGENFHCSFAHELVGFRTCEKRLKARTFVQKCVRLRGWNVPPEKRHTDIVLVPFIIKKHISKYIIRSNIIMSWTKLKLEMIKTRTVLEPSGQL